MIWVVLSLEEEIVAVLDDMVAVELFVVNGHVVARSEVQMRVLVRVLLAVVGKGDRDDGVGAG